MGIYSALKKYFGRKTHPTELPYDATPSQSFKTTPPSSSNNDDASYTEVEADLHNIAGTTISFGQKKSIQVDQNQNTHDLIQKQSYILGSGKLVCSPDQIEGVCEFCQALAMEKFQAGQLPIEQAQLQSLYEKASAAKCNICGRNTCSMHTRPIKIDDQHINVCLQCQKDLKPKFRILKAIAYLLISPFLEQTQTPESKKD